MQGKGAQARFEGGAFAWCICMARTRRQAGRLVQLQLHPRVQDPPLPRPRSRGRAWEGLLEHVLPAASKFPVFLPTESATGALGLETRQDGAGTAGSTKPPQRPRPDAHSLTHTDLSAFKATAQPAQNRLFSQSPARHPCRAPGNTSTAEPEEF